MLLHVAQNVCLDIVGRDYSNLSQLALPMSISPPLSLCWSLYCAVPYCPCTLEYLLCPYHTCYTNSITLVWDRLGASYSHCPLLSLTFTQWKGVICRFPLPPIHPLLVPCSPSAATHHYIPCTSDRSYTPSLFDQIDYSNRLQNSILSLCCNE